MKNVGKMTCGELGAYVSTHLEKHGIDVTLSGGSCVTIYTDNKYISHDLDFIECLPLSKRGKIVDILKLIGFKEMGRHFSHTETEFFIEFPPGPLSLGEEPAKELNKIKYSTGTLKLLSPTDCVKDRLASYYHWKDQQGLDQAILIINDNDVNINEVERWSKAEGMADTYKKIKKLFIQT